MKDHVATIIESLLKVIDKMNEKSEASKKMSTLFEELSRSEYNLSNNTLKKLIGVHESSGDTDKQYALEFQNQLIFYLRDCEGDINESISVLKYLRDSKEKVLKELIEKNINPSMEDSLWEEFRQVKQTEKNLGRELETFKSLTNKNIKFLFDLFFRVNNRYNKDVFEIWKKNDNGGPELENVEHL